MGFRSSSERLEEPLGGRGLQDDAAGRVRLALLALWFAFMASTPTWVPIYQGTGSGEGLLFVWFFVVLSAVAWVRGRAETTADAIVSALPSILFVAVAGIAGGLQIDANDGERGEPLFVYFGVALLASWAILVLATAIAARTRWSRLGGLLLGVAVAVCGYGLMIIQVD